MGAPAANSPPLPPAPNPRPIDLDGWDPPLWRIPFKLHDWGTEWCAPLPPGSPVPDEFDGWRPGVLDPSNPPVGPHPEGSSSFPEGWTLWGVY